MLNRHRALLPAYLPRSSRTETSRTASSLASKWPSQNVHNDDLLSLFSSLSRCCRAASITGLASGPTVSQMGLEVPCGVAIAAVRLRQFFLTRKACREKRNASCEQPTHYLASADSLFSFHRFCVYLAFSLAVRTDHRRSYGSPLHIIEKAHCNLL